MTELHQSSNELDVLTNQTTFAEEYPIYESDHPVQSPMEPKPPMGRRQKTLLFAAVGIVSLLVVLSIVVAMVPKKQVVQQTQTGLQYSPKPAADSELRLRVRELSQNLNDADPVKMDVPFPPVDLQITLDQPRR